MVEYLMHICVRKQLSTSNKCKTCHGQQKPNEFIAIYQMILQKNFSLSTSTTDSTTLKSSDNSSVHNSSSIAAKYTALNKFVTSKIPHNSIKNVIARSLTTNLLENSSHQTSLYASKIPTTTTDQSFGSKTSRRFATIRGKIT